MAAVSGSNRIYAVSGQKSAKPTANYVPRVVKSSGGRSRRRRDSGPYRRNRRTMLRLIQLVDFGAPARSRWSLPQASAAVVTDSRRNGNVIAL